MNYGMFTDAGNSAVASIVQDAKKNGTPWSQVYYKLEELTKSDREKYGEAMDTEVRELVYNAIGAYDRDEDFWV